MTRYNNLGLKRKYEEATQYREEPEAGPSNATLPVAQDEHGANDQASDVPKKKKRKRGKSRKSQVDGNVQEAGGEDTNGNSNLPPGESNAKKSAHGKKKPGTKAEKGKRKLREARGPDARKLASERRRLKRQDEATMDTICYACRERGHSARNCPKALAANGEQNGRSKLGRQVVGICYRCGSKRHSLSKCPKPIDPENSLPFASCFVCSGTGHLASSCPQNQSKGVYPNGGCCKLCGETTHLAKNCTLRKNEPVSSAVFIGIGTEAGADEDDFHTFKRKTVEVAKEERADERRKRSAGVKVGAFSGVVQPFGSTVQKPKKVVMF